MSEIWQFASFLGAVAVVFVLWLSIIYLPGRTLEHRYDGEAGRGPDDRSADSGEESPIRSGSDRTR